MAKPIGVFDSGLGGLTVVHAIRARLPERDIVYLGDTARVPYGTRSADTVRRYAKACADRLLQEGVERIVIACNTVSAVAVVDLEQHVSVPVHDVVRPGASAGVAASLSGRIGVLATQGTIDSGAYQREIGRLRSDAHVVGVPAPLLVPLAEEGWLDGEVPRLAAQRYIEALADERVDTVVLGCTHYPLLRSTIEAVAKGVLGERTKVVDSAQATALALEAALAPVQKGDGALGQKSGPEPERVGQLRLLVTDLPSRFDAVASRFLSSPSNTIPQATLVDL